MQYVPFGSISDRISRFGLGCMRLPPVTLPDGKKDFDDEASIKMIRAAIDAGVNYLDTAYVYGRSEEIVGKALLDGYREKVILSTKMPMSEVKCKEDLQRFFDLELQRLQTDYIDVYHLHNLHKGHWRKVLEFGALDFIRELKAKGLIRHCAFSVHERIDHLREILDAFPWELAMIQYNYLDKFNQMGQEGLKLIASKGIPVVAMEPLHGGLLAQDVPEQIIKAFGDFRPELNQAEKAFMWLYNQPEVSVILSGSSSMEQLNDTLRIFENARANCLTEADETAYDRARAAWEQMVKVSCTSCQYCMPCPANVNIPEVFRIYNESARDPRHSQRWLYGAILVNSGEDASKCINCQQCVSKCPQFIPIPEMLREAHEAITGKKLS